MSGTCIEFGCEDRPQRRDATRDSPGVRRRETRGRMRASIDVQPGHEMPGCARRCAARHASVKQRRGLEQSPAGAAVASGRRALHAAPAALQAARTSRRLRRLRRGAGSGQAAVELDTCCEQQHGRARRASVDRSASRSRWARPFSRGIDLAFPFARRARRPAPSVRGRAAARMLPAPRRDGVGRLRARSRVRKVVHAITMRRFEEVGRRGRVTIRLSWPSTRSPREMRPDRRRSSTSNVSAAVGR